MTKQNEIYKCDVCGNIIEVLSEGAGELVCCEEPMTLLKEKTDGEHTEHHKPIFMKKDNNEIIVKIGEKEHPMTKEHHIKMIEIFNEDGVVRKYCITEESPEMCIKNDKNPTHARAYCNLHGLWKGINDIL